MKKRYLLIFDCTKGYQFYYDSLSRDTFKHMRRENITSFNTNAIKIFDHYKNCIVSAASATQSGGKIIYRHDSRESIDKLNACIKQYMDKVYAEGVPY